MANGQEAGRIYEAIAMSPQRTRYEQLRIRKHWCPPSRELQRELDAAQQAEVVGQGDRVINAVRGYGWNEVRIKGVVRAPREISERMKPYWHGQTTHEATDALNRHRTECTECIDHWSKP